MKKLFSVLILVIVCVCCFFLRSSPEFLNQTVLDISKRVHVYCECYNSWINGRVENFAHMELRDGTSFGSILLDAAVEVNGQTLVYDDDTQTYRGDIGNVEQWQEIPIRIQTQDNRKVRGHVVVVFMVEFTQPKPLSNVPSSRAFPVSWKYSEGSMHTVDLEIFSDEREPVGIEVRGNHTTVDLSRMGIEINRGENLHLRVLPPWTSNYEFSGNLTRRSKAYFITSATLTVRLNKYE
ncbi:MAG: hypothetical protein JSV17_01225 [Candidatus Aminicenantes bacterium]|nr:MAG: hypothetical protein JSV17_01225 [Candidatus Aminicenantes bacterium]